MAPMRGLIRLGAFVVILQLPGLARAQTLPPPAPPDERAVEVPTGPEGVLLTPDGTGELGLRKGEYGITFTGLIQVQAAPYVGKDSLVENDDPATTEGFRVRRARFGAYGQLPQHFKYRLYFELFDDISASTVDGRPVGSRLRDALIAWDKYKVAVLEVGAGKVWLSRGNTTSSAEAAIIEDPFVIKRLGCNHPGCIGLDRRVGASLSGTAGPISYGAGVYNGDSALSFGSRGSGFLYAGRAEFATAPIGYGQSTVGPGSNAPKGFAAGAGASYRRDPTTDGYTVGGDLALRMPFLVATGEVLMSHWKPLGSPQLPVMPSAVAEGTSVGMYLTLAVALLPKQLELVGRVEWYAGNTKIDDENDIVVTAVGLNAAILEGNVKAGLNFQHRQELHGRALENDALLLQGQASF